jgi:hypothetical protein
LRRRGWLERARADLHACDAWHQISFRKTHDLDELKQMCLPLAEGATAHLAGIERLSQYAWRFRYPGAPYSPERAEAEEARHAAGQLLDAVASRLESQFGARVTRKYAPKPRSEGPAAMFFANLWLVQ